MKKLHRARDFLAGVLVTLLVASLALPVSAAITAKTIDVYTGISIFVDGLEMKPTDVNGNPVEVFVYNGTTYVPLRAVSQSLGKEVAYDGDTQTVYIGEKPGNNSEPAPTAAPAYSPVGAPGVGVSLDTTILGGPLSATVNSVDGVKLLWVARNDSGKTINYYTVHLAFYNRVGDPAYDEITGESTKAIKTVGPIAPGEDLAVYSIVTYSPVCSKITITSIDLEYSDGTKETVYYGYSTPNF